MGFPKSAYFHFLCWFASWISKAVFSTTIDTYISDTHTQASDH